MSGNGGVIGPINTPTVSTASGVWSLSKQQQAKEDSIWPAPLTALFLVVGGGASGGGQFYHSAGGGAGGYLETSVAIPLTDGAVYTVTIGAGGAYPSSSTQGNAGSSSSVSGTGMTTATALGGGGGARGYGNSGAPGTRDGGSGGGGGGNSGASMTLESYQGGGGVQTAPTSDWGAYANDGGDNEYGSSQAP